MSYADQMRWGKAMSGCMVRTYRWNGKPGAALYYGGKRYGLMDMEYDLAKELAEKLGAVLKDVGEVRCVEDIEPRVKIGFTHVEDEGFELNGPY